VDAWNTFSRNMNETLIRQTADAIVANMWRTKKDVTNALAQVPAKRALP